MQFCSFLSNLVGLLKHGRLALLVLQRDLVLQKVCTPLPKDNIQYIKIVH